MEINCYYNPVKTVEGSGSLGRLAELAGEAVPAGCAPRVLLLTWSETMGKLPEIEALRDAVGAGAFRMERFCASNPTVDQLYTLYEKTRTFAPNLIVAVGGGSVMDVGKTLCLLTGMDIASEEALRSIIVDKRYQTPTVRWIGVPTTAGTGSEVTCWATIWDPEQEAKRSVESRKNYAYAAVVDARLSSGMPLQLAVSSALDAAAHGMESYWAKAANLVSSAFALEGIRRIMGNIDALLAGEETAHEAMAQGSMLTGLAFSNTKTTACHSISYPLTMEYQIPHGAAVSLLMGPVLCLNWELIPQLKPLLDALGIKRPEELSGRIRRILKAAGIPSSLEAWGVPEEALPKLASLGMTKGRADNNPAPLTQEVILGLLRQSYGKREEEAGQAVKKDAV